MPKELNAALSSHEGRISRIAGIIDEMKGEEIVVMDLRGICDFADAFIIATVRSSTHMNALVANLLGRLKAEGLRPLTTPEPGPVRWALLDYSNVIVHIFDAEARAYYDLEHLWGDAATVAWPSLASA